MVYIMLGKRKSIFLDVNNLVLLNLQIKAILELNCNFYIQIRNCLGAERLNSRVVLIFLWDKTLNFSLDTCKARPFFLTTLILH